MLEVSAYLILITLWWIASFTIFLPFFILLVFNKSIQNAWFATFLCRCAFPFVGEKFCQLRKDTLQILKNHLSKSKKSGPLEILEIGIGGGSNLEFYPENCNLTALDVNKYFEKYLRENQGKFPHVKYKKTVLNMAENMTDLADSSFDVVIGTYVLCSVQNPEAALKEVKRVLKPGGKYLFLEHVAFSKDKLRFALQKYSSPLWKVFFDGCFITRNSIDPIMKAGFKDVYSEEHIYKFLPLWAQPHIRGIATKY